MASANRHRGAAFLSCLILLCLVDISDSSATALAAAENDDDGDDIGIIDATKDEIDNFDIDAKMVTDGDGIIVDASALDQDDSGNERRTPSSEGDSRSQEEILLGETVDSSSIHNMDDENRRELQYTPPTHFQITAHVQTNLHTGYSYFLPKESLPTSFAHLPFLECGAVGSTTESLPLVSGVFRHVPHTALVPKRDDATMNVVLENLEQAMEKDDARQNSVGGGGNNNFDGLDMLDEDHDDAKSNEPNNHDTASSSEDIDSDGHPKRPSPPKYVVALSSVEITVGGNGNETQKFHAGDVIFIEDTWWGVWDNHEDIDSLDDTNLNQKGEVDENIEASSKEIEKMKGYIMRASSESETDLNVLMLTVPNAIHRHWKNAQYAMAMARREDQRVAEQQQKQQQSTSSEPGTLNPTRSEFGTRRPWWKLPTAFLNKQGSKLQEQALPEPCSLEPDPAFALPSAISSTTLSQHFTRHFTGMLRRSTNPHPSFLPHHHQDLLLPILAQTAAAMVGGATALALVLQLWRIIPGPIAVGFGSACLIGLGTWGFVWLGEEILDQLELWKERRRLERMTSEGWGRGGGSGSGT